MKSVEVTPLTVMSTTTTEEVVVGIESPVLGLGSSEGWSGTLPFRRSIHTNRRSAPSSLEEIQGEGQRDRGRGLSHPCLLYGLLPLGLRRLEAAAADVFDLRGQRVTVTGSGRGRRRENSSGATLYRTVVHGRGRDRRGPSSWGSRLFLRRRGSGSPFSDPKGKLRSGSVGTPRAQSRSEGEVEKSGHKTTPVLPSSKSETLREKKGVGKGPLPRRGGSG